MKTQVTGVPLGVGGCEGGEEAEGEVGGLHLVGVGVFGLVSWRVGGSLCQGAPGEVRGVQSEKSESQLRWGASRHSCLRGRERRYSGKTEAKVAEQASKRNDA